MKCKWGAIACMPFITGGRGLVKGQIFNRQGQLVASTMQEGVVRQR
jgi:acyl-CoA thioesterase-2